MHAKTSDFSATDIASFLACHHLLTLDRAEEAGEIERSFFYDPGVELLRELGLKHEQAYLCHLTDTLGLQVIHIPTDVPWADAVSRTVEAIREGAGAVYQATFQVGSALSRVRTGASRIFHRSISGWPRGSPDRTPCSFIKQSRTPFQISK